MVPTRLVSDTETLEDHPAVQHRANRNVRGRHRRTTPLHSHRAPTTPITEKGRYAVAAALVAGVGVASVAAATDGASSSPAAAQARTQTAAAQVPLIASPSPTAVPTPSVTPSAAVDAAVASVDGLNLDTGVPFVAQGRKAKPLPLWVNPLPEAAVTSCFGQRWGRLHAGVDLAAADGTRIRAAGAGTVVAAGPAEGYGNAVLIDHGNGYLTHYGHMSAITVVLGQKVKAGDQIGNEGSTGHSTGPHLHFEVHEGTYQNPIEPTRWMHDHGVDIPGCPTPTS
ncbi:M23 family metallopeptidase [Actinoplanes friuliensis]|uniref:SPBc2 prophage-derived transglycosylase n=1 Tax=Actinoplanes friuliensis DSM 7358 TaxID=1246995 RepID=U5VR29_9ACTN|nr:M23 family metallopeptidase [Actinoplanes friuliensis]AGZ39304.1 SPBc2 prophage-derived transglycosylase [Actinoplanes friuliensis DSM 7358]